MTHLPRPLRPGESRLCDADYDPFARLSLDLMRYHFQTFAVPHSQGWLRALIRATAVVGPQAAGPLCYDVVTVIQTLRVQRSSVFCYSNPDCALCCTVLTSDERRMTDVLEGIRARMPGRAQAAAMILCEAGDADLLVAAIQVYVTRHAGPLAERDATTSALYKHDKLHQE